MKFEDELTGQWWLPQCPANRRYGQFRADSDGDWHLTLTGGLQDQKDQLGTVVEMIPRMERQPMILGETERGSVTLIGCDGVSLGPGVEPTRQTWHVQSLVEGIHLRDEFENVNDVRIEFGSVFEWSGADPPSLSWADERIELTTERQIIGRAVVGQDTFELVVNHRFHGDSSYASIQRVAVFAVSREGGIDLRRAMNELVFPLRDLLAVLTLGHVSIEPLSFRASPVATVDERALTRGLYYTRIQQPAKPTEPPHRHEMLLPLRTSPINFESLIRNWFSTRVRLRKTISMLVVPTYAPYLYADDKFLTAFLGAESLHRAAIGGTAVPEGDHTKRVEAIVAGSPEQYREWVEIVLRNKNEKGQKTKLNEVVDGAGTTGVAIRTALPTFVKKCVKARQLVAHPGDSESADGRVFVYLGDGIRWVLRHHVLVHLGLDEADATRIISTNDAFRRCLEQLASL